MKWQGPGLVPIVLGVLILAAASPAAWAGDPVCAKGYITLRKGPGPKHPVSWKVARYMPFMRTERKSGWVKVEDLEGDVHWAKSGDVTTSIRCVVIKNNIAILRREPNSGAPTSDIKTADRYTPFKRLGNDRDWVQIEDETGRVAWVHETNVWRPVNVTAISF